VCNPEFAEVDPADTVVYCRVRLPSTSCGACPSRQGVSLSPYAACTASTTTAAILLKASATGAYQAYVRGQMVGAITGDPSKGADSYVTNTKSRRPAIVVAVRVAPTVSCPLRTRLESNLRGMMPCHPVAETQAAWGAGGAPCQRNDDTVTDRARGLTPPPILILPN
jgi:hypothetical protein